MSFDIFLQTCRFEGGSESIKNPFTGETAVVRTTSGLTTTERKAIRQLLRDVGATGPDEFGCYIIDLPDAGYAEVYASKLAGRQKCDSLMVSVRGLSPGLVAFLYDVLRAGHITAIPTMDDIRALVAREELRNLQLDSDAPPTLFVRDAAELGAFLGGGFGAWEKYRDWVTG